MQCAASLILCVYFSQFLSFSLKFEDTQRKKSLFQKVFVYSNLAIREPNQPQEAQAQGGLLMKNPSGGNEIVVLTMKTRSELREINASSGRAREGSEFIVPKRHTSFLPRNFTADQFAPEYFFTFTFEQIIDFWWR